VYKKVAACEGLGIAQLKEGIPLAGPHVRQLFPGGGEPRPVDRQGAAAAEGGPQADLLLPGAAHPEARGGCTHDKHQAGAFLQLQHFILPSKDTLKSFGDSEHLLQPSTWRPWGGQGANPALACLVSNSGGCICDRRKCDALSVLH
jgi:hypothetical protein